MFPDGANGALESDVLAQYFRINRRRLGSNLRALGKRRAGDCTRLSLQPGDRRSKGTPPYLHVLEERAKHDLALVDSKKKKQ